MEYDDKISQIPLRVSRDRMIDLLGIGNPFPVRDLQVNHNQKAQFNQEMEIKVVHAQDQVRYTVHDANLMELSPPQQGLIGTGEVLILKTPPITKDSTFRLLAERLAPAQNPGASPKVLAQNFLHYNIVLRVGIDVAVIAFIREAGGPEKFLKQIFVDYGRYVEVQVGSLAIPPQGFSANAQEEVTYSLVSRFFKNTINKSARKEEVLSIDVEGDDRLEVERDGKRSDPPLFRTRNFTESIEIEVKVYEKGAPSIHEFLDSNMRVYVRPNPVRQLSDFTLKDNFVPALASNEIILSKVDVSEAYQCYIRPLERQDYAADGSPQLPATKDPASYPHHSDYVSLEFRLLQGIERMLTQATLNEDDRKILQDAQIRLQQSPPSFPPNSLRELMMTLESAANRAQWPSAEVPWVEAPVVMPMVAGIMQRDYVVHVRASKWDSAHRYDPGSQVWLNQGFVVQVMNAELQAQLLFMYPNGLSRTDTSSFINFQQVFQIQLGLHISLETDANWWSVRSQKGMSYQAVLLVKGKEIIVSKTLKGNGTQLVLNQIPSFHFEEDAEISIKAFQSEKPTEFVYLQRRLKVYVTPNPLRSAQEVVLQDSFHARNVGNQITLNKIYVSEAYQCHIRLLKRNEFGTDGSPQLPQAGDLASYNIKGDHISLEVRLLMGIDHMLTHATLSEQDRSILQDAKTRLQSSPPSFPPNSLLTLMATLKSAANRPQWPSSVVAWPEDPVLLPIPAGGLQHDYVIHVRASKWSESHRYNVGSQVWLNQSFVVQVMNPKLFAELRVYLPEARRFVPKPSPITIDYQETLAFQVGVEAFTENDTNWLQARTQKGMSYQAIILTDGTETIISDTREGNGQMLVLSQAATYKFEEDATIRIKAFQTQNPQKFIYLDSVMQVRVRPNPAIAVRLKKSIIPYEANAIISLKPIQASVDYEVYAKTLGLFEYSPDGRLEIQNHRNIQGLQKIGSASSGNLGTELRIDTGAHREDTVFIIRATKRDPNNGESLILNTPLVLRVEPDLKPLVKIKQPSLTSGSSTEVVLHQTQQGVNYQLRIKGSNPATLIGNPGYHVTDRAVAKIKDRREFGMRVGTDFRIGNKSNTSNNLFPDTSLALPTGAIQTDTTFEVVATKSYTGLSVILTETANVEIANPTS